MTKSAEFAWVEVVQKVDPNYDRARPSYEFNGKSFYSPKKKKMQEVERANQFKLGDHMMAKNVAEMLEKKYPGWLWAVSVDRGLVTVKSMMLSGNWGFILHESKVDNDLKSVVQAGGEILERYNQHRGKFNQTKYSDLTMDTKGQLSGDRS